MTYSKNQLKFQKDASNWGSINVVKLNYLVFLEQETHSISKVRLSFDGNFICIFLANWPLVVLRRNLIIWPGLSKSYVITKIDKDLGDHNNVWE